MFDFVTRSGTQFMLDGTQFKFVGVNAYGMTGGQDGTPWTTAELNTYFNSLRPKSVTRTWAMRTQGAAAVQAAVASAEAHGQKLILALTDGNGYSDDITHDAAWYLGGYTGAYFDWVRQVVPLVKNSPAVMMWEIMNEPRSAGVTPAQMKTFLDASAALIKSLDPNHLVATGSLSQDEAGTTDFALIHSGPNIDAGSLHEYDYEYLNSRTILSPHFAGAKAALDSVNKPIYVGECGISISGDSKTTRSNTMKAKCDAYLPAGSSGVLEWGYSVRPANINDPLSGTSDGPGDPIMTMLAGYVI